MLSARRSAVAAADLKTKKTKASVVGFLRSVEDERRRADSRTLVRMMRTVTKAEPAMWGPSIVGFGAYRYRYDSGREGDWFLTGFSPRKAALSIYEMSGFKGHDALMSRLGRFKAGKGCLYVRSLADVDLAVLKALLSASVREVRARYRHVNKS